MGKKLYKPKNTLADLNVLWHPSKLVYAYSNKKVRAVNSNVDYVQETFVLANMLNEVTVGKTTYQNPSEVSFQWSEDKIEKFELQFVKLVELLVTLVENQESVDEFLNDYKMYQGECLVYFKNKNLLEVTDELYGNLFGNSDRWNCYRIAKCISIFEFIKNRFNEQMMEIKKAKVIVDHL